MINDEFKPHPPKQVETFVDLSAFFSGFMAWDLQKSTMHQEIQRLDHAFAQKLLAPHPDAGWWVFLFFLEEGQAVGFLLMEDIWFFPPGIHLEACI